MVEMMRSRQSECCDGCSHADTCQKVYDQLGQTEEPSVAWKAIVAFALPVVVFGAALVGFEWLLGEAVAPRYRTPLALPLALTVAVGLMLVVSRVTQRRSKRH